MIIPGFGGFIAHHVDAKYDENDGLWLPPYRTLGFNPLLTLNDSLLVQSYVEAYDMSYPDALRQIEAEVENLKNVLHTESMYEMDGIGTIRVNIEGNYEFEPCEAGILSPELYGLADFSFKRFSDEELLEETDSATETAQEIRTSQEDEKPSPALLDFIENDTDDESHAIVVKMSWIRNAVAIAAAVACFFLLATPIANSDLGTKTMSQLQGNIIYKLMPKDSNMTPAQPVVENEEETTVAKTDGKADVEPVAKTETKPTANVKSVAKAETKPEPKAETKSEAVSLTEVHEKNIYCVVLASQVKRSNAEEFVERLKKRGFTDARINVDNGTLRVICGRYANESQAYQRLNKISVNEEFFDAWVYKLKGV